MLGARHHAPGHCSVPAETTIRRTLGRLDTQVLAGAIGAWLADRDGKDPGNPAGGRRRAVAVDGKTLRGAQGATADGRPVHLLACMGHTTRAVLAQRQVGGAPEEVPAFAPLLADLDLTGVVVTADALQTHPEAAEFLVTQKQAHHLFVVKANQPILLERCADLPWHRVPGGRPHPRPRPRPRRAAHPQSGLRPPLRVPARRPGPAGHPQEPRRDRGAEPSGPVNLAAALRRHARDPRRPLATLGISLG